MILDQRLTWTKHNNYIIDRCNRRLNILRALSGTDWGTDKKTMTTLYRTLIRSIMEYGATAYDSASKSTKEMLNIIQSKALRICLNIIQSNALRICCGAMISTSVEALQIECGEIPRDPNYEEMSCNYNMQPSYREEVTTQQKKSYRTAGIIMRLTPVERSRSPSKSRYSRQSSETQTC